MRVHQQFLVLLVSLLLLAIWTPAADCALSPTNRLFARSHNKTTPVVRQSVFGRSKSDTSFSKAAQETPLRSLATPQNVLRGTAAVLLLLGLTGLLSPTTLHGKLFRHSYETLTWRVQARYLAFAVREILVAASLLGAVRFSRGTWRDHFWFCVLLVATELGVVPYLFGCLGRDRRAPAAGSAPLPTGSS